MGQGESTSGTCSASNCRPCASSNPTSDTVKIDQAALKATAHAPEDKENANPGNQADELAAAAAAAAAAEEQAKREAENRKREEQRRREQEEAQRRAEEEARRVAAEEARRVAAEEEKKRVEAEAKEVWRRAKEAEALKEQERKEAERRELERKQAQAKLEREQAAQAVKDRASVAAFLESNGYSAINAKRSRMMKKTYPLHEAVQQNNATMVQLLLAAGAEATAQSSAGQTPQQLAEKLNKAGSHSQVLQVFSIYASHPR